MGAIIELYKLTHIDPSSLAKPIVYCKPDKDLFAESVSINIPLANELQKQSTAMMRTMRMEQNLITVLNLLPENPVVRDFDVMFNPEYQMDVIKALINVYRKKAFSVIWPGRYEDGKLFYAEEGYRDYKVFNVNDYDITVVI